MNQSDDCELCRYMRTNAPERTLYQDRYWAVITLPQLPAPGWLVIVLQRHAVGIEALNRSELMTFGPTIARVSAALRSATQAERVYFVSFGENFPHFHVLLMPRDSTVPVPHRGPFLQLHMSDYTDEVRMGTVTQLVRAALSMEPTGQRAEPDSET